MSAPATAAKPAEAATTVRPPRRIRAGERARARARHRARVRSGRGAVAFCETTFGRGARAHPSNARPPQDAAASGEKRKADIEIFEEDDEFEEFTMEDWDETKEDTDDQKLWQARRRAPEARRAREAYACLRRMTGTTTTSTTTSAAT